MLRENVMICQYLGNLVICN